MANKVNNCLNNRSINAEISAIAHWHHERNLVDGTTDLKQAEKMLEEYVEMVSAFMAGDSADNVYSTVKAMLDKLMLNGRIKKTEIENKKEAVKDAIGDQIVVLINHSERNELTLNECVSSSYDEIKDRKGKMINGIFTKEGDF